MTNISGAVVLVTGANGGLGVEFVAQALERGATKVYAAARTPRSWDDERIVPLRLDVTDAASVAEAAKHAGDTTVVINNAGVGGPEPISSAEFDDIRSVMETNFFGALAVARDFAPVLARNGGGALVNVLSVASWIAGMGAYSASKAAIVGLTRDLAQQWGSRKGIRVNAIAPGFFKSEMTDQYKPDYLESLSARFVLPRMGDPAELAATLVWLASPAAGYVTGQTIAVDGGVTIT